jgi:hypothetical protein
MKKIYTYFKERIWFFILMASITLNIIYALRPSYKEGVTEGYYYGFHQGVMQEKQDDKLLIYDHPNGTVIDTLYE